MDIIVKVVPHCTQRYDTVGDWYFVGGEDTPNPQMLMIMVSFMGNPLFEYLVSMHEQVEAMQCLHDGVKEKDVSAFDIKYEEERPTGDTSEPGDSPLAPYHLQHKLATQIEMQLAEALGVNWKEYDDAVNAL